MYQPSYYQGRRYLAFRATSHACTYIYVWVRQRRLRLVRTDAFWSDAYRKRLYL